MSILDRLFGKTDVSKELTGKMPYAVKTRFTPYRLTAHKNECVNLDVSVKNVSGEDLMTSVVVQVPNKLGVDATGLNKSREVRLGYMKAGEEKEVSVKICGSSATIPANYGLLVTVFCHYRDYQHVLNYVRRKVYLRAEK
ncbi:MAG: hypothetical protein NT157_03955 [Candidatus Micrarchaeota archaeon]|nr:hypothetical protein [Candidatus Micrarchaeota archaeon]